MKRGEMKKGDYVIVKYGEHEDVYRFFRYFINPKPMTSKPKKCWITPVTVDPFEDYLLMGSETFQVPTELVFPMTKQQTDDYLTLKEL